MKAFLQLEDLWDAVEVKENVEVDKKKDQKALSRIILSIDKINYSHIKDVTSAKDAWSKLKNAFEDSGLTRKVGLLRTLVTTQLEKCKSVEKYCDTILTTAHKLREMNLKIDDEWIGTLLLAGLTEEYRPMIMGIESSGIKITGDSIKVKLLQDVKVQVTSSKTGNDEQAFYSKQHKTSLRDVKCYKCNKFGHMARTCLENRGYPPPERNGTKVIIKQKVQYLHVLLQIQLKVLIGILTLVLQCM